MRNRVWLLGWLIGVWCQGLVARADAPVVLSVLLAQSKQLKIDGELGEWRGARFVRVGSDDAGRAEVALAYDSQTLYVGARVYDDAFVRSARPSSAEDALVLSLALPAAGSFATSELWLFAGRIGQSPASAQLAAAGSKQLQPLGRARIVEGPLAAGDDGYAIEASIPWSSLPHAADWAYARGSVRVHDVDRAGGPAKDLPALAKRAGQLPFLLFDGGPVEAARSFLDQKNLSSAMPALDWVGDVRDDARAERVVVIGTFVLRSGAGSNFAYADLPVTQAADVRAAEMLDLTGDGKPELIVRLRSEREQGQSELWRVFDVSSEAISSQFAIETRKQVKRGTIEADVSIAAGKPPKVSVRAGPARAVSEADYVETALHGVVPIPVPWGAWVERVYAWDGHGFALQKERANPAAPAADSGKAAPASSPASAENAPIISEPVAASEADLLNAYKTARGIAAKQAGRFAQHADVAGDARPEALAMFGRDCVVVGAGFRGGRDFFFFTLPAREDADVLQLTTADVSGDGKKELLARIRQQIGPVTREVLFVYTFAGEALAPLLAAEVRRTEGDRSITNAVSMVPGAKHVTLRVAPGVARGWSASDYPYSSGTGDGVAPLLLPWMDKPTDYKYDGRRLVPRLSKD